MPSYFDLPPRKQTELLESAKEETGIASQIIEKDIWLSFVLKAVFSAPGAKPMAFKGGTSLSKVYSIIQRFSEDVDITIDYRSLGCELTIAEMLMLSGRKVRKIRESLHEQVREYVNEIIVAHLHRQIAALPCGDECGVEVSDDGELVKFFYPTRIMRTSSSGYLRDHVLIEFGGRNIIDPHSTHAVTPNLAALVSSVDFPVAENVVVLDPERTFWEKATLIHASCHKGFPSSAERYSRHWYDLAMFCQHSRGTSAKTDLDLLRDVIDLKSVFYKSGTTNYAHCLDGQICFIPSPDDERLLRIDYYAMQDAGMLNGHDMSMDLILATLQTLQDEINATTSA